MKIKNLFKNKKSSLGFAKRGVTLAEVLIIIAVIGIITAIALPQFSKIKENQIQKVAVEDVLSSLNKARSQTLSSLDSSSYGIHFQSDKVLIFKGEVFSVDGADNEIINIISPASISNVTLGEVSGESGDIYFNRLSGAPNQSGSITISTPSFSKIITIYPTGVFSVN